MRTSLRFPSRCRVALAAILVSAAGVALADTASTTPAAQSRPTEWKEWNGQYFRLEADGHLSCYHDGSSRSECTASFPDPAKQKPLSCNSLSWLDAGKEAVTGYQMVGHWCNTAYANLFADWEPYGRLGYNVILATGPRGDVMCLSTDGTTCLSSDTPEVPDNVLPVVCGRPLRARENFTGYDNPKHWCSSRELVSMNDEFSRSKGLTLTWENVSQVFRSIPMPAWNAGQAPEWTFVLTRHTTNSASYGQSTISIGLNAAEGRSPALPTSVTIPDNHWFWTATRDEAAEFQRTRRSWAGHEGLRVALSVARDGTIQAKHETDSHGWGPWQERVHIAKAAHWATDRHFAWMSAWEPLSSNTRTKWKSRVDELTTGDSLLFQSGTKVRPFVSAADARFDIEDMWMTRERRQRPEL